MWAHCDMKIQIPQFLGLSLQNSTEPPAGNSMLTAPIGCEHALLLLGMRKRVTFCGGAAQIHSELTDSEYRLSAPAQTGKFRRIDAILYDRHRRGA